jgi:predicted Rossmann-fold nucleotide-binding protein
LALVQTRKTPPVPIILIGQDYWRRVFDPEFLYQEGVIAAEDLELFWFAETAEDAWNGIRRWYEKKGEPLGKADGVGL